MPLDTGDHGTLLEAMRLPIQSAPNVCFEVMWNTSYALLLSAFDVQFAHVFWLASDCYLRSFSVESSSAEHSSSREYANKILQPPVLSGRSWQVPWIT